MQLKYKLKFVIPIFSIFLLILSYFQFESGYQFSQEIVGINQDDIKLAQELSGIKGKSRLNSIGENMQALNSMLSVLFDRFDISDIDKDGIVIGIDKIGEFRDIAITVKGDFWQQIYFLKQVNKNLREFLVIKQLNSNNTQALFNARVYGREN